MTNNNNKPLQEKVRVRDNLLDIIDIPGYIEVSSLEKGHQLVNKFLEDSKSNSKEGARTLYQLMSYKYAMSQKGIDQFTVRIKDISPKYFTTLEEAFKKILHEKTIGDFFLWYIKNPLTYAFAACLCISCLTTIASPVTIGMTFIFACGMAMTPPPANPKLEQFKASFDRALEADKGLQIDKNQGNLSPGLKR